MRPPDCRDCGLQVDSDDGETGDLCERCKLLAKVVARMREDGGRPDG